MQFLKFLLCFKILIFLGKKADFTYDIPCYYNFQFHASFHIFEMNQ
jgi:hypothetical protein